MACNTYQGSNEELHLRYEGKHEELARMLCRVCIVLEAAKVKFPSDLGAWWQKHKDWDEKTK